jgi:hypothetical protein
MPPVIRKTTTTSRMRTTGRPATGGFQYKGRTPEEVKERASRAVGGRDGYFHPDIKYFTAREGLNTIRILPMPSTKDWRHYGFTIYAHYEIGPDKSAYLCLAKMKGEECPICEERSAASNAGEDELAKMLRFGERVPMFVVDRAHEGDGPMIWNVSGGMDKDISKLCVDPGTGEILLVDHPEDGYDFSFTRTGTGLKTKYSGYQFSRRTSALSDDPKVAEAWLQYITDHAIDDMLVFKDAEYIAKVLDGQPAPSSAPVAEEQPNPRTATTTASGGRGNGKARIAPAKDPEPAKEAPAGDDTPTWAELLEMDETQLGELGDSYEDFPWPAELEDVDAMRKHVADTLGVEIPPPPPASGGNASWKERFRSKQAGK